MKKLNVAVLGDGGWGTTLAMMLFKKGLNVTLWGAFADYVDYLDQKRINVKFLPGIRIPAGIEITHDLKKALKDKKLIVLTIPSQHIRRILRRVKKCPYRRDAIFLSATKGIEVGSLKRISEIIHGELGNPKLAVLSGPTIAHEVASGIPTVAVIASRQKKIGEYLQNIFISERFRVYTSDDVIGVELGGALKNIIAIACGISDGLKFGANTKSAILARGLSELARLGKVMGARVGTFSGISGLGDLVTTCISPYSRNRFVGEEIGRGKSLAQIQSHMQMVAEGIPTTKSAYALSLKYKVDMPITGEVYRVLYKNKLPLNAFKDLMGRKKKEE
ncbi:MAG: NAD(P)H-dependent glycerol-3-phosphate dehydrogenase [Candidatus Omnitrophota bacterium]|nr:NAD(P)H-dependent glycerol-3-phosphate dehydrogenase [Candidatus Omnitrophota bacterium]